MTNYIEYVDSDAQATQERERLMAELELVQRIERGMATQEDARYVARALGLTTEKS